MAQPGLHSMATAVSAKAKVKGKDKKRKKSTMVGRACATGTDVSYYCASVIFLIAYAPSHPHPFADYESIVRCFVIQSLLCHTFIIMGNC